MSRLSRRTRAGYAALRKQFTKPALILSIVALVLAVAGGAYAAGGGLSSKQKKEVTAIAKKYAGKPGANGTNGTTGAPGEKGAAGTNGSNGSNGVSAEATSFTGASEPVDANCSHEGGLEVKSGGPLKYVCNGKKGETGFTETLPSGQSETGWMELYHYFPGGGFGESASGLISFPIPVENASHEAPTPHYLRQNEPSTTECPGSVEEPKAKPGNLCLYERESEDIESPFEFLVPNVYGSNGKITPTGGAFLGHSGGGNGEVREVARWVVTAE